MESGNASFTVHLAKTLLEQTAFTVFTARKPTPHRDPGPPHLTLDRKTDSSPTPLQPQGNVGEGTEAT